MSPGLKEDEVNDQFDEIEAFRRTTTSDINRPQTFVDWPWVTAAEAQLIEAVGALQQVQNHEHGNSTALAGALLTPRASEVITLLYASPSGAGFERQRELSGAQPTSDEDARKLASLLEELAWWVYFPPGADISSAVRAALIARDARRRTYRRRGEFASRVRELITDAAANVSAAFPDVEVRALESRQYPAALRGRVDGVVAADDQPVAAISVVFETESGGRQYRNLSEVLPALQRELDQLPASLIVIADGRGVAEAPRRTLEALFQSVAACMSFQQAEGGTLAEEILAAVRQRGARQNIVMNLDVLIRTLLFEAGSASVEDLPVEPERASREMRLFVERESSLALTYAEDEGTLRWRREAQVAAARELRLHFDSQLAIDVFSELLAASQEEFPGAEGRVLRLPLDQVLPELLPAEALPAGVDAQAVRALARHAGRVSRETRLAVLLTTDAAPWLSSPERLSVQRQMAASVVVLTPDDLLEMSRLSTLPRDTFATKVLAQADLSRNSPFVWTSVTPERIFRGRRREIDFVRDTVATNSVAIVGGRRIGKTSLMRRLEAILLEEDFRPFYLDCHPVGNWASFAQLAARSWNVPVGDDFSPEEVFDLIACLSQSGRAVLILDEIDALLRWDLDSHSDHPREALFKSFRAASQEGRAQFVFSGERVIAERLWDPASPHWNFSRELRLQQLERDAATALLVDPIRALQIMPVDLDEFEDHAWRYTSGHPQLVQFLGDLLIQLLNDRPPDARGTLAPEDLALVADSGTFRRKYLDTYWGQSTEEEKAVSIEIATGRTTFDALLGGTAADGLTSDELNYILKMLELYGIIDWKETEIALRAEWMNQALDIFGGPEAALRGFSSVAE